MAQRRSTEAARPTESVRNSILMQLQIEQWPAARPAATEQWRDVVDFEAFYEVSSRGRVRRRETGRILKPWIAAKRYHYVHLFTAHRKRKVGVHVLVTEAFHGPKPSPRHEVAHWDGRCTHNTSTNLRWATHAENIEDQRRHGTMHPPVMKGAAHPRSKLKDDDVVQIRRVYSGRRGELSELADFYGVDRSTVQRVAVRTAWAHI
jgi:hypothetical protein